MGMGEATPIPLCSLPLLALSVAFEVCRLGVYAFV